MTNPKVKKKCNKGFECGYTCIKRGRTCWKNPSPAVEQQLSAYVNATTQIADLRGSSKQVGKGAFGTAYLTPNGTVVKAIEDGVTPNEVEVSKLMGEAGYSPKVIASGKIGKYDYIEMEYLDGYRPAAKGGMSKAQSDKLFEAMVFLHKAGYSHDDMHMNNVMVNDATGDAKLIDYSLVTKIENSDFSDLARFEFSGYKLPEGSLQARTNDLLYPKEGKKATGRARDVIIKDYIAELNKAAKKPRAARRPVAFVNDSTTIEDIITQGKRVGNGAYGDVYLTPNKTVAKVVEAGLDKNEVNAQKLMGDAGFAPKVLYSGGKNGVGILEMEYLKDYKPAGKVNKGIINEKQAKKLMDAVSFLHKNGLTHNDMHFENVMVNSKTGDAKLIDYGLTTDADTLRKVIGDLYDVERFGHNWGKGTPQRTLLDKYAKREIKFDDPEALEEYLRELRG